MAMYTLAAILSAIAAFDQIYYNCVKRHVKQDIATTHCLH